MQKKLINKTKYTDSHLFNILINDDYRNLKIESILNDKKLEKEFDIKANVFLTLNINSNSNIIELSNVIGIGKKVFYINNNIFIFFKLIYPCYNEFFGFYNEVNIYSVGENFLISV